MTTMNEGKTTDCVMEGIRLWKEVYTGKAVNVSMIQDDVLAVCKERDALLRLIRLKDEALKKIEDYSIGSDTFLHKLAKDAHNLKK